MAWYLNHYKCGECGSNWQDEWSCMCDDECPECGASDYSPVDSEDLSVLLESDGEVFEIYVSPSTAGYGPDYRLLATTPNQQFANILQRIAQELPDKFLDIHVAA